MSKKDPPPSSVDTCAAEHAIAQLLALKGVVRSLPEWIEDWTHFVGSVESGYTLTVYDYTNDVSIRQMLDEVMEVASDPCRQTIRAALRPIDERYLEATMEPSTGDPEQRSGNPWYRAPRVLVGEFRNDLVRWYEP
ncbi:MAG: hypothetical protein ACJ76P_06025 [Actinomycetota bacterium]